MAGSPAGSGRSPSLVPDDDARWFVRGSQSPEELVDGPDVLAIHAEEHGGDVPQVHDATECLQHEA
jgi:hypothetical protein